jgi:hypothetical protein
LAEKTDKEKIEDKTYPIDASEGVRGRTAAEIREANKHVHPRLRVDDAEFDAADAFLEELKTEMDGIAEDLKAEGEVDYFEQSKREYAARELPGEVEDGAYSGNYESLPPPKLGTGPAAGSMRFHELLQEMGELHDKKQADYGRPDDPFANVRASEDFGITGWIGCMMRANDKMRRLQTAAKGSTLLNEGVRDSLMDLAVYSLIGLILYEEDKYAGIPQPESKGGDWMKDRAKNRAFVAGENTMMASGDDTHGGPFASAEPEDPGPPMAGYDLEPDERHDGGPMDGPIDRPLNDHFAPREDRVGF